MKKLSRLAGATADRHRPDPKSIKVVNKRKSLLLPAQRDRLNQALDPG